MITVVKNVSEKTNLLYFKTNINVSDIRFLCEYPIFFQIENQSLAKQNLFVLSSMYCKTALCINQQNPKLRTNWEMWRE